MRQALEIAARSQNGPFCQRLCACSNALDWASWSLASCEESRRSSTLSKSKGRSARTFSDSVIESLNRVSTRASSASYFMRSIGLPDVSMAWPIRSRKASIFSEGDIATRPLGLREMEIWSYQNKADR